MMDKTVHLYWHDSKVIKPSVKEFYTHISVCPLGDGTGPGLLMTGLCGAVRGVCGM